MEKQPVNWRKTLRNNAYMLRLIAKASPGVVILTLFHEIQNAVYYFLVDVFLYQYALNAMQERKSMREILITLGAIAAFAVLQPIFWNLKNAYLEVKKPRVEAFIQNLLQKKATEVDLACFEQSEFYDVYVKATSEATDRAYAVLEDIGGFLWVTINAGAIFVLIFTINPIFLLLASLPLFITLLVGRKRNRLRYKYNMERKELERRKDYVRRTFYLQDYAKEMRLTTVWRVMYRRMHDTVAELKALVNQYGYTLMFYRYLFDFAFDILVDTGSIILAAYKTLVSKTMLLGDCFVVINSISQIAYCINDFGDMVFKLDENSLYIDNLRAFLEYDVQISEDPHAPEVPKFETLTLRNLSFGYQAEHPVLRNVDLTIRAGERIAIVGHNGAGKTTLIKLLLRLYDPTDGEILLNGKPIHLYRLSSYRNMFGTVFQDYRLFATSVAENVMLRSNISEADRKNVEDALEKSGIAEKIASLPYGMDTVVTKEFDKNGAAFSGGEAQKLSIARIFAGNHEIVIMDEPTSALDPIAEQEMYQNMFAACEGKTVIFISHRLSSAVMADRIYLFEHGEIIEQGNHSELLSRGGTYADMWHKQADSYLEDSEVMA